jgi:hypothetical protein
LPSGKIYAPGGPSLGLKGCIWFLEIVYFFKFLGEQRSCDGRGRAAPVWRVYELKRTGARSAQARTRGQNPLVTSDLSSQIIVLGFSPNAARY